MNMNKVSSFLFLEYEIVGYFCPQLVVQFGESVEYLGHVV